MPLLKHKSYNVRGDLKAAVKVNEALLKALIDSDKNVRLAAARALGVIASNDPSVHNALVRAVMDTTKTLAMQQPRSWNRSSLFIPILSI